MLLTVLCSYNAVAGGASLLAMGVVAKVVLVRVPSVRRLRGCARGGFAGESRLCEWF